MRRPTVPVRWLAAILAVACLLPPACEAADPEVRSLIADEQRAMRPLAGFDGVWRGPARTTVAPGQTLSLTQTERVGGFLDGSVKVIEGRGYGDDGTLLFNAFGVISFSPATGQYHFRANAQGRGADFPIEIAQDRFVWSMPAGAATIRYTATVRDGVWTEIGEWLADGRPPVRIHEMTLQRIGDTDWPAAGAVPPR